MGFVRIQDTLVHQFDRGVTVDERLLPEVERLIETGAVSKVAADDVPPDAIHAPGEADASETAGEALQEPDEPEAPAEETVPEPESETPAAETKAEPERASSKSRSTS